MILQNIPESLSLEQLQQSFSVYDPKAIQINKNTPSTSISLRFINDDNNTILDKVKILQLQLQNNKEGYVISDVKELKKPCLFLRNISHLSNEKVEKLLVNFKDNILRSQFIGN